MKRLILIFVIMIVCIAGSYAQENIFFNTKLRIELMDYLVSMRLASSDDYNDLALYCPNLTIRNLLTNEIVDFSNATYEYGIYSFNGMIVHGTKHILLKNGSKYQILQMNGWDWPDESGHIIAKGARDFNVIIMDLFQYFRDNPDVDPQLLPLYTNAVINVYFDNYILSEPNYELIKKEYYRILRGEELDPID